MTFAEKLKSARKQAGMSQEQLAEKLGVSRQAVTKWETDTGTPDIENIMAISALFRISIDELLTNEVGAKLPNDFLFESVTEYDIAESKRYDMKFGGAKKLVVSGYQGEKIRIRLASNALPELQSDFKVKIDDVKSRIDIDLHRKKDVMEATAKERQYIFVQIPSPYVGRIECAVHAEEVELRALECENIELDVKTSNVVIDGVIGVVEINCNLDMNVDCRTLSGAIEINQISAVSRITVPDDANFAVVKKGIRNSIFYERDGRPSEPFDVRDSEHMIQLNGMKSELVICARRLEKPLI